MREVTGYALIPEGIPYGEQPICRVGGYAVHAMLHPAQELELVARIVDPPPDRPSASLQVSVETMTLHVQHWERTHLYRRKERRALARSYEVPPPRGRRTARQVPDGLLWRGVFWAREGTPEAVITWAARHLPAPPPEPIWARPLGCSSSKRSRGG